MTGSSAFIASKTVVTAELPDGAALLDMSAGKYFGLDLVGAAIWRHIESSEISTLDAIAQSVSTSFDISMEDCIGDILGFIQTLVQRGLVETLHDRSGEIAA